MDNFETYIFDLDGTLLNTIQDLAASCNYALRCSNMPEYSVDEVRMMVGNGVKKLMERAIPEGLNNPRFEETYASFRKHYLEHNLDTTGPYPGIMDLLKNLKAHGKKVAVVSNKFYAATQALCKHFFSDYVDVAIGEDLVLELLRHGNRLEVLEPQELRQRIAEEFTAASAMYGNNNK